MIRAAEIRVIADDGEQLGVMTPEAAIARAEEVGLDLVEVAPAARPPVCRIMDYGRYKYEQKKKANKSKGHAASLKEVKLRPRTDQHDLDFKLKNARRFLMEGDKVKVTVMYRGREMVHREIGRKQLDHVVEMLGHDRGGRESAAHGGPLPLDDPGAESRGDRAREEGRAQGRAARRPSAEAAEQPRRAAEPRAERRAARREPDACPR